jgi:hypothetical protein
MNLSIVHFWHKRCCDLLVIFLPIDFGEDLDVERRWGRKNGEHRIQKEAMCEVFEKNNEVREKGDEQ